MPSRHDVPRATSRRGRATPAYVLLVCAALVVAVLVIGVLPRVLRGTTAPAVYALAGGGREAHGVVAALVVLATAVLPPAALAVRDLARRHRAAWALLAPVVAVGVVLVGFLPGRNDRGRAENALTAAAGVPDAGEVLTNTTTIALMGLLAVLFGGIALRAWFDRRYPPEVRRGRPDARELQRLAAGEVTETEAARLRRRGLAVVGLQVLVWSAALAGALAVVPG